MKDYFEHIDDYIAGTISAEEKTLFINEMKKNNSLKEAVTNYPDAKKLSEGLLEIDMLNTLEKLEQEANGKSSPSKSAFKWKWLLLGALIVSLCIAGWWFFNKPAPMLDKNQILASYERPVDLEATKSTAILDMTAFEKGKNYFGLNRFIDSEHWFRVNLTIEKDPKQLSKNYYWLGAAHLEQWELDEAKAAWEKSDEEQAKRNLEMLINYLSTQK